MCLVEHPTGCARYPLDCFRLRIRSARATRADCSDLTSSNGLRRKAMRDDVGTIVRSEQSALCRHRYNTDYADPMIVPTSRRNPS
jgi:hypothetical protein